MIEAWLSHRCRSIDIANIQRMFALARGRKDLVNLSLGQPDFDVPPMIQESLIRAMREGKNGYSVAHGIPELRERLAADARTRYNHGDRDVLVTGGTSGGLALALQCVLDPGDEAIILDPYFMIYPPLIALAGGRAVAVDLLPDFQVDLDRVRAAITPRTKVILVNSPSNPTGAVLNGESAQGLARLAAEKGVLLISDEIYSRFAYDQPHISPAEFNEHVLVIDGFSKSHAMTGWRLGYAHGPKRLLEEMAKLQQIVFVHAATIVQHAALAAWECDMTPYMMDYRRKRDRICAALEGRFEHVRPGGAFYVFPKAPPCGGAAFAEACLAGGLLITPGRAFSARDTHFRLSFAVDDATMDRGMELLAAAALN